MDNSLRRPRRSRSGHQRREAPPMNPCAERDSGYSSSNSSFGSTQSECNHGNAGVVADYDWSRDSPSNLEERAFRLRLLSEGDQVRDPFPYPNDQFNRVENMSESDWSRDSPPNFHEEPFREDNSAVISSPKRCQQNLSAVEVVSFLIFAAVVLYFVHSLFYRGINVNQNVKITQNSHRGRFSFNF